MVVKNDLWETGCLFTITANVFHLVEKKNQSNTRLNKCDLVDNEPPIFINIPSG